MSTDSDIVEKKWPCAMEAERITPCWALSEVLQPSGRGTRTQGLERLTLVNMETFEHSRDLIVLKSGKHGKKGLTLNFCPYCRQELREGAEASLALIATEGASHES